MISEDKITAKVFLFLLPSLILVVSIVNTISLLPMCFGESKAFAKLRFTF